MSVKTLNEATMLVVLNAQKNQNNLGQFIQSVLEGNAQKESSIAMIEETIESLTVLKDALAGEGTPELRACGVMSYSGESSTISPNENK